MLLFLIISGGVLAIYAWIILSRYWAWRNLPLFSPAGLPVVTTISVLIPVRNEARGIRQLLQDLAAQTYPKQLFEVLVLDDHSEDETAQIVADFAGMNDLPLRLVRLADFAGIQQKKAALATGIALATGELILQTDGDCRVPPAWLKTYAHYYAQTGAPCISGPVCLITDGSLFAGMQLVEFAALVGIGAGSIGLGVPNMCNGANLAYSRQAFLEVQGFTGNAHVASGDDEFLMHKMADRYPGKIAFIKSPAATVFTGAHTSAGAFLEQRVRWASKWPHYKKVRIKLLALTVFGVNLLLFLALLFFFFGQLSGWEVASLYLIKFGLDGLFLAQVLQFFQRREYLVYLLPLQLVYIPYVLFTALQGLRGTYRWKGRQVTKPR